MFGSTSIRRPAATRECEFAFETESALLTFPLRVKDGAAGTTGWVGCGTCDTGWQVPHYAENVR